MANSRFAIVNHDLPSTGKPKYEPPTNEIGITLDFSWPGKPTDNAFIEAFNSKLRAECLNAHWFLSLSDACKKMETWRRYYNEERPHSTIGNIPPITLANVAGDTSPSC